LLLPEGIKTKIDMMAQYVKVLSNKNEKPLQETLSNRKYQVILMIASGKTVKAIANELSLSVKTISTNPVRALGKMGMKNNAEITYYAIKHGLVE
jgi:DNA-binding NarL/FixJ family response regulator